MKFTIRTVATLFEKKQIAPYIKLGFQFDKYQFDNLWSCRDNTEISVEINSLNDLLLLQKATKSDLIIQYKTGKILINN